MAGMAFTYDVLENGPREFIFTAIGIDATTTTAFTSEAAVTGIIAAAVTAASTTYAPSVHNKVRRIIYNTTNCAIRLQWHQTSNADLITLSGYGDWNSKDCQGITNPNGTGSTGDIDSITIPTSSVTSGAGIVTAAASLQIYLIKGV